jgi:hypothetical protein
MYANSETAGLSELHGPSTMMARRRSATLPSKPNEAAHDLPAHDDCWTSGRPHGPSGPSRDRAAGRRGYRGGVLRPTDLSPARGDQPAGEVRLRKTHPGAEGKGGKDNQRHAKGAEPASHCPELFRAFRRERSESYLPVARSSTIRTLATWSYGPVTTTSRGRASAS